ncbi:LLM class flavin-dependent oxidoreductase [Pseudonocardia ailaonensis]|uniref:LLM class flavin-dependent oxidoreductase n=1 Tax=Pseudonocardia ailaonensis TaxID=367279 RepID=A0ABN2MK05_9PSEU
MAELHLTLFVNGVGHHEGVWRSPRTDPARAHGLGWFTELARTAERGLFDAVFLADVPVLAAGAERDVQERLDPVSVLSALAGTTERIGLIGTASTTYGDPFTLARQFATLDHLSGGRAGWNVVTTSIPAAAENFGAAELPDHATRYRRAHEFVEVVTGLWDGWADHALVRDRVLGRYLDPARVRRLDHRGEHFSVRGPLNVPRPPQGRPVLVQAGSSAAGIGLAARFAETVFTAQWEIDEAARFAVELRAAIAVAGRDPATVPILPGLVPILGGTETDARRLAAEFAALTDTAVGISLLRNQLGGLDLSGDDLDAPFPDVLSRIAPSAPQHRARLLTRLAAAERLSLREVLGRLAGGHGHRVVVGTPEQIAAELGAWFRAGAADGFTVMPADLPQGLTDFVDHVVPLLRRSGLTRPDYRGTTLRNHLGLARPQVPIQSSPVTAGEERR